MTSETVLRALLTVRNDGPMDEPFFTRPGEGERIGSRAYRVLAELPDIEALDLSFGPDFEGVDPHTHADHTDSFYVLEGELEFLQDGNWHRVGPGTFLSAPPNVEHGFRSCGVAVRVLNLHTPNAGFIRGLRSATPE
jgi:mannose-6-phosphate isomerase-like protein (cupin superfamily)